MAAIVSGTDFRLCVSRKIRDWVGRSDVSFQEAFRAALAFVRDALPLAVAHLGSTDIFAVFHFNSAMVVRLDRDRRIFCVVAFYVDDHDPCPPDGSRLATRRPMLAAEMAARLGLTPHAAQIIDVTIVEPKISTALHEYLFDASPKTLIHHTLTSYLQSAGAMNSLPIGSYGPRVSHHSELIISQQLSADRSSSTHASVCDAIPVDGGRAGLAVLSMSARSFGLTVGIQPRSL